MEAICINFTDGSLSCINIFDFLCEFAGWSFVIALISGFIIGTLVVTGCFD